LGHSVVITNTVYSVAVLSLKVWPGEVRTWTQSVKPSWDTDAGCQEFANPVSNHQRRCVTRWRPLL